MGMIVLIVIIVLIGGGMWVWPFLAGILGISSITDKPGALRHIRQLMVTYDISPGEVETTFIAPAAVDAAATKRDKGDIAKTLFVYLGAIFILAGIGTYIGMFWSSMGSVMRIFVTLGIGYILLLVLVSALHGNKYPRAVGPLTFAMVFMMVGGWLVLIDEVFPSTSNWRNVLLFVSGTLAVHMGVLFGKYQRTLFAFFGLFFVYGFMQVGLDMLGMSYAHIWGLSVPGWHGVGKDTTACPCGVGALDWIVLVERRPVRCDSERDSRQLGKPDHWREPGHYSVWAAQGG